MTIIDSKTKVPIGWAIAIIVFLTGQTAFLATKLSTMTSLIDQSIEQAADAKDERKESRDKLASLDRVVGVLSSIAENQTRRIEVLEQEVAKLREKLR